MELSKQQNASQKNLSFIIARSLGQLILKESYLSDTILPSELELSKQFNASRTAIREAIKILAAKGMVLARPELVLSDARF